MNDSGAAARSDAPASRPPSRRHVAAAGTPLPSSAPRVIRVLLRGDWITRHAQGLLGPDPRVRTLRKVLVTYPDVRHILPDRISFEPTADPRTMDTVARFLERQQWLVKSVTVD